jgi:hypothetical protein
MLIDLTKVIEQLFEKSIISFALKMRWKIEIDKEERE